MTQALDLYGNLEEAPNQRMVVRVIGHRVGTASGWFHFGGHAVLLPNFEVEPGFHLYAPGVDKVPENTGLLIDYYAGLLALIPHVAEGATDPVDNTPIWTGNIMIKVE